MAQIRTEASRRSSDVEHRVTPLARKRSLAAEGYGAGDLVLAKIQGQYPPVRFAGELLNLDFSIIERRMAAWLEKDI